MNEPLAPLLVSSYAVSPAHATWDPDLEAELLPALCALPDVVGLEAVSYTHLTLPTILLV